MFKPPVDGYGPQRAAVSRVAIALCLSVSSVACAHPRAEELNELVEEYDAAAGRVNWPGFSPTDVPLILYDDASTYLIRHPAPPEPFRKMRGTPDVWWADTLFAGLSANTDTEFAGERSAVARIPARVEDPRGAAALAMHEAFHAYQSEAHPGWTANEADLFTYPVRSAALLQLRRLEGGALRRAISPPDSVRELCWAQAFLRVRDERARRLPAEAIAYDRATELREGLARYVQGLVDGKEPVIPADGFRPEDVRERAYEVGHGVARLLDRLAPGWKADLVASEGPVSLDAMLRSAIGDRPVRRCGASPDETARARSVARTDSVDLENRDRRALAAFRDAPGWSVDVVADGAGLQVSMFDPLNVRVFGERQVLHTRWLMLAGQGVDVEVLDRGALTLGRPGHPLFAGVDRLTVTGLTEPSIEQSGDTLTVAHDGFRLTAVGATVEREGQEIRIVASR